MPGDQTDLNTVVRSGPSRPNNKPDIRPSKRQKLGVSDDSCTKLIPACDAYEKSYMHRDIVTHVLLTKTQFLITASQDGVIKFWKKNHIGIDFVKSFKCHPGIIDDMAITPTGHELASISRKDKSVKIFDIVNFDMINIIALEFEPKCVEWIERSLDNGENLIISDSKSSCLFTFNSNQTTDGPLNKIDKIHSSAVSRMRRNPKHDIIVSVDELGIFKYWRARNCRYECIVHPMAQNGSVIPHFMQTSEQCQKIAVHNITFSPCGDYFLTTSSDRIVRMYKLNSTKLILVRDESLSAITELHKKEPIMDNMTFARKMAIERELDKNKSTAFENALFDQTGSFIIYPTMIGVKIWNRKTGKLVKVLGKEETNFRPLAIALFQGVILKKSVIKFDANTIDEMKSDPTLYASSYKKNRFYCFSNRNFEENVTEGEGGELIKDRDIYNEQPTREELIAAVDMEQQFE